MCLQDIRLATRTTQSVRTIVADVNGRARLPDLSKAYMWWVIDIFGTYQHCQVNDDTAGPIKVPPDMRWTYTTLEMMVYTRESVGGYWRGGLIVVGGAGAQYYVYSLDFDDDSFTKSVMEP